MCINTLDRCFYPDSEVCNASSSRSADNENLAYHPTLTYAPPVRAAGLIRTGVLSDHVCILCLCRSGPVLHEDASTGEPGAPGGGADAAVSAGG